MNYNRMPGPGDLYSPKDEPAFGWDDACGNVGDALIRSGDVGELVEILANAYPMLCALGQADIAPGNLHDYRSLLRIASEIRDRVNQEYNTLNGIGHGF